MLAPRITVCPVQQMIAMEPGRERFLKRALKPVFPNYDFIVIDSPPSKGILTYNAILAADFLVIPTECTPKGVMGAVSTVVLLKELEDLDFKVPKFWELCRLATSGRGQSNPNVQSAR